MQIKKHIPNTITSMNLLCGFLGVVFSLDGRLDIAFPLMLAAAVFDFCDGLAARLLKAYSEIGKELDSLSDMVSFGILPSAMLYETMKLNLPAEPTVLQTILIYSPAILAIFSGLRLAKFNVDERQHESFIGLATPAAAMLCGALAYFSMMSPDSCITELFCGNCWTIPVLAVALAALLVSEVPMFAMKFGTGHKVPTSTTVMRIAFFSAILISVAVVIICGLNWSLTIALAFLSYIVINLIGAIFTR